MRGDFNLVEYGFTRRPLAIEARVSLAGEKEPQQMFVFCMHAKSKIVGGGRRLWLSNQVEKRLEFVRKAVYARRRIAAECLRVRQCIDRVIYATERKPLICLFGDLNDGPGADLIESLYLLTNPADLVLGKKISIPIELLAVLVHFFSI